MGTIAIITLVLAVPPALVALSSLFEKSKGRLGNANPATPERNAARFAYELTCVYAPKAFFVISLFSFNYQNANPVVHQSSGSNPPSLETGASVDGNHIGLANIDAASENGSSFSGAELPHHRQDLHD